MAYIFMDESGDLGFNANKQNSNYFIVTFLFCKETKPLYKIIKKTVSGLSKKQIKIGSGMLHATKEKPSTRIKILQSCLDKDISIMTICLNKSKVYTKLQDEKHVLYNYVVNMLLGSILTKKLIPLDDIVHFVASRRETSKVLNDNFLGYLQSQTQMHQCQINFHIKTPYEEKALQVVDFISWSVYQKYERDNESYYEIIKSLIVEEKRLFS